MATDEYAVLAREQEERARALLQLFWQDGAATDVAVLDLLENMAMIGLQLVPTRPDVNVASAAYLTALRDALLGDAPTGVVTPLDTPFWPDPT